MSDSYRLGVDIGGTFTDLVLMNEETGATVSHKVPSQPRDPSRAVVEGTSDVIQQQGIDPKAIEYFVHGTTLALNTVIQRSGAKTGMLVTRGFKDVLEIGRLRLPDPTNYYVEKPQPLIARKMVREINERLLANGRVYQPLDMVGVDQATEELVELGAESIAICFMHSYKSDQHERQAAQYIREHYPNVYVTASSEIWPQQREFERAMVTSINAHVGHRMQEYFGHLVENMRSLGVPAPIFTTKSNGGIMTAETASDVPVETLLSGPAAGVIGALHFGRLSGHDRLITLDIGGTSADVAVIDRDVFYATESKVGDFPVFMPAVDISSIGAGGGSIAWIDRSGLVKVGPRSAGADPGPACYGRGGTEPTVTDAYVALGLIQPENFLGGRIRLDASKAKEALEKVGSTLGLNATETAASIIDVTTSNMYAQFIPAMARRGVDPRDFAILAYGGAGPTHAFLLAKEVGIKTVIVPPSPGTLCAMGSLVADIKSDFIQTLYIETSNVSVSELDRQFVQLEHDARAWLADQGGQSMEHYIVRSADMRYKGQSFDITVPLTEAFEDATDIDAIHQPFHESYERIYGFSDPDAPVDLLNIRVTIVGVTPKPQSASRATDGSGPRIATPAGTRQIMENRTWVDASVFDRDQLNPNDTFDGPAIVDAADTTIFVPSGFSATVDDWGNIIAQEG